MSSFLNPVNLRVYEHSFQILGFQLVGWISPERLKLDLKVKFVLHSLRKLTSIIKGKLLMVTHGRWGVSLVYEMYLCAAFKKN